MAFESTVRALRSQVAAVAAARAVFECRVALEGAMGLGDRRPLDAKLHAFEMAYYRRADELGKRRAPLPKRKAKKR